MSENQNEDVLREAEEVVREAAAKLDVDGSDCPAGEACAIHFRNDEEVLDDSMRDGRMITYTGDYAVITCINPELTMPSTLIKLALGLYSSDNLPSRYETIVVRVGGGSLGDTRSEPQSDQVRRIMFTQKHDSWENFKNAHEAIVASVKDNTIDLSTPAIDKE